MNSEAAVTVLVRDSQRLVLLAEVSAGSPLALKALMELGDQDDDLSDHPWMSFDAVLELLSVYGIHGDALARIWVFLERDPEALRLMTYAVSEGWLPLYQMRSAAIGLRPKVDWSWLREQLRAVTGAPMAG